jgi:hypothetical protein
MVTSALQRSPPRRGRTADDRQANLQAADRSAWDAHLRHARQPALYEAIDGTRPNIQKQLGTSSVDERRTHLLGVLAVLLLLVPLSVCCHHVQGVSCELQDSQARTGAVHIIDITAVV